MKERLHALSELSRLKSPNSSVNLDKTKEMNMETVNSYYNATVTYYNHTKRFGFAKVCIPAGTTLAFDISANDQKWSKDEKLINATDLQDYSEGDVLDNDINVKAFVHATTVASAGYQMGLKEEQEIQVKIALHEKGIQVEKIYSVNTNSNEERLANEFLAFVPATVKMCEEGRFGFVSIKHHFKTGEPLDKPVDAYFNWHLVQRAQYSEVSEGDVMIVKYYTFNNGKSSVTLIKYADKSQEEIAQYRSQVEDKAA